MAWDDWKKEGRKPDPIKESKVHPAVGFLLLIILIILAGFLKNCLG